MASRPVLTSVAAAAWSCAAAVALAERNRAPRPVEEPPLDGGPLVSVILPARDEAGGIGPAVASHLAQTYANLEVIVVDDQSSDGTAAAAHTAAAGDGRLRVVDGAPLPDGWIGKSWACWQGVQRARGEWLLFTDADVVHAPDALGRCLALAERLGRGGLTLVPRVDTGTIAERIVMPAAASLIQNVLAPGFLVRSPRTRLAMAAGAYLLVRRDVYDGFGGHRGVSGRMVDDVAVATAVKRTGHLLVPTDGTDLIHLRMYPSAGEMWRGWSKNAAFAASRDPSRGLIPAAALIALALAPAVGAARALAHRRPRRALIGLGGFAAQCVLQRMAAPIVATPARYAPTFPLGAVFIAAAAARGAVDRLSGRGPAWRGRRYPAAR